MNQFDPDLCSVQEARILAENAKKAQELLQGFSDRDLNRIIDGMISDIKPRLKEFALSSYYETRRGRWEDKYKKNCFICDCLTEQLKRECYVGIISEDRGKKTVDIGVPAGVIAAFLPSCNPVSTAIYKALIAVKSGNAVIFSIQPLAGNTTRTVLDLLIHSSVKYGLPEGAVSYLSNSDKRGIEELICHRAVSRIFITGMKELLSRALKSGKPVIYGGSGNGPAFIERTADLKKAVDDIIESKTFDFGIVSGAEQAVVAERCISGEVIRLFEKKGGSFLSEEDSVKLGKFLGWNDGIPNQEAIGRSALYLAEKAGISVPKETSVLIVPQKYAGSPGAFSRQNLCPVLTFFIEDNWRSACETCIELLVKEEAGHTLVIHSRNEDVIREFALKKPVARVLVNTPAVFGGMGATTNLFPSMSLGSITLGSGAAADNISPANFIHIRKVGYGVRPFQVKESTKNDMGQEMMKDEASVYGENKDLF